MQNKVPHLTSQDTVSSIDQAINRSLRGVRQTAADEVNRLVESALVLIQRSERLEPRVSEIVKQAGLHNQAFYRHFRSKRELLVAVLDRGIAILASYLRHRMEGASTAEGEVREWFRGMLEQALAAEGAEATRPFALARGRLAESYPDEVARSEQQLTALLRDTIVRAQARGELLAADPDRAPEALYLLAMGWIERRLREASPPTREDAVWLEEFALAGLTRAGDRARTEAPSATSASVARVSRE